MVTNGTTGGCTCTKSGQSYSGSRRTVRLLASALAAAALAAACARADDNATRRLPLTGTVAGREASPPRVIVAHDAVETFMPAMTMPFEIRGATPFMRDGDRVAATLVVTGDRSWLEDVTVTPSSAESDAGARAPVADAATPGALVPPLPLVNQHGDPFTLHDFRQRVLVLTFIYTRCPLPDFCPLMVSHLETVRRRAREAGAGDQVRFLAVTLDPAFDTPAVLKSWGESVLKGADRFTEWTLATGSAQQVQDVARFFGIDFRAADGLVTHTLVTAVVGSDGRVARIFPSNSWLPGAVFDMVQAEAAR